MAKNPTKAQERFIQHKEESTVTKVPKKNKENAIKFINEINKKK